MRDTYGEAWRVRVETDDVSPELLVKTFRDTSPPPGVDAERLAGQVILDLWNQGVEPRNLKRELYRGLGRAFWQATVVPGKAIYDSFRGRSEN